MSLKNRKDQYEKNKDNTTNHLLSPALKAEFEPDSVTPEMKAEEEAKAKASAEAAIKKEDTTEPTTAELKEVDTPGATE